MNSVSSDARQARRPASRATVRNRIAGAGAALIVWLTLAAAMRPAQTPMGTEHLEQKPTATVKVCHMCDDDQVAATATPPATALCSECDVSGTRAAVQSTAWAEILRETPIASSQAVHVAMFWMQGCPACEEIIQDVLPPLKAGYGSRLDALLIEVATQEEVDRLFALAADLGIPKEQTGVPFLIIGDQVLVGSTRIAKDLPGLIATYLARGGVNLPSSPILGPELIRAIAFDPGLTAADSQTPARPQGFVLATVVLVAMVAALLYAIASVFFQRLPIPRGRWGDQAVLWLAVLGLVVAGYLAYVETQAVAAICGPVGDCNVVQASPYARLFGVLPVGILGVLAYLFFLAAWVAERRAAGRLATWAGLVSFLIALVGTAFSIYLTFLETFVIRAVCLWCLTSAVTMTLLLLLTLNSPRARRLPLRQVRQ